MFSAEHDLARDCIHAATYICELIMQIVRHVFLHPCVAKEPGITKNNDGACCYSASVSNFSCFM